MRSLINNREYLQNSNNLSPTPVNNLTEHTTIDYFPASPRYKEILHNKAQKKTGKLTSLGHNPSPNPFGDEEGPIDLVKLDKKKLREHLNPINYSPIPDSVKSSSIPRNSKANVKLKPIEAGSSHFAVEHRKGKLSLT